MEVDLCARAVVVQLNNAAFTVRKVVDELDTADDLCLTGKVPDKAYRAYTTAHGNFKAVRERITDLQQCLLPSSTDIVASAVAYLQLVAQDDDMFVALAQSGQLSKQCMHIAEALQCAQQGYEALGADLLELQCELQHTEHKMQLDLEAAHKHVSKKLARRKVQQKAGPAAAAAGAVFFAGLVAAVVFPPLALVVGPAAGALAAADAGESADHARWRAEQQLSRTEDIAAFCDATQKQLQQAIDLVAATSCVVHLAGFFSSLAAATSRAGRTAERVEACSADAQSRGYAALRAVLLQQLGMVAASGASFAAVMGRLQGRDEHATLDSQKKPTYRKVACSAQELRATLRAIEQ